MATSFVAFTIIVTRMSSTHVLKTSVLAAMLVPSKGLKETVGTVEDLDGAAKVTMVMQVKFDNKILSLVGEGEDYIYDDSGSSSGAPTDGQP